MNDRYTMLQVHQCVLNNISLLMQYDGNGVHLLLKYYRKLQDTNCFFFLFLYKVLLTIIILNVALILKKCSALFFVCAFKYKLYILFSLFFIST